MEPRLNHREGKLYTDLSILIGQATEVTELTADVAAAGTALTVRDIDGFAINKVLIIGELGVEASEVVKTHTATAPTGTTITLLAGVEFAHSAGTKVYMVDYDQIEISHADTATGVKSVLATVAVQADELEQMYTDTTETAGYYFARFKNTITTTYSSYSPPVPYSGYGDNTVGYAINFALRRNGMKTFDEEITQLFCMEEVNDCLQEWQGKLKRWSEYFTSNYNIGNMTAGVPVVALPTDIHDTESNQSLTSLRLGDGTKLYWYESEEFDDLKEGEIRTQVQTEASAGDTTLVVDNIGDFADTGTLNVYVSGTAYSLTYTAVNRTTNTFSGIPATGTGAITVTIPVDTYIHQGATFGTPSRYTVREGNIELDYIPDASNHNRNLKGDYWKVATSVSSQDDVLDVKQFHAIKYWLAWKVRMQKKNDGMLDQNDGFYAKYKERMNDAVRTAPKIKSFKSRPFLRHNVTD